METYSDRDHTDTCDRRQTTSSEPYHSIDKTKPLVTFFLKNDTESGWTINPIRSPLGHPIQQKVCNQRNSIDYDLLRDGKYLINLAGEQNYIMGFKCSEQCDFNIDDFTSLLRLDPRKREERIGTFKNQQGFTLLSFERVGSSEAGII